MTTQTTDTPAPGAPAAATPSNAPAPAAGTPGSPASPTPAPGAPAPVAGNPAGGTPSAAAPTAYADFTLPQGVTLGAEAMNEFKTFAKDLGLSQENAQKIVDNRVKQIQASEAAAEAVWTQQLSTWETDLRADKEFGGPNFEKTVQTANAAIAKFGGDSLAKLLKDSGFEKNPDVVRAFARVGALLKEDNPGAITMQGNGQPAESAEQRAIKNWYK